MGRQHLLELGGSQDLLSRHTGNRRECLLPQPSDDIIVGEDRIRIAGQGFQKEGKLRFAEPFMKHKLTDAVVVQFEGKILRPVISRLVHRFAAKVEHGP